MMSDNTNKPKIRHALQHDQTATLCGSPVVPEGNLIDGATFARSRRPAITCTYCRDALEFNTDSDSDWW